MRATFNHGLWIVRPLPGGPHYEGLPRIRFKYYSVHAVHPRASRVSGLSVPQMAR